MGSFLKIIYAIIYLGCPVNDLPRSVLFDSNEARLFVGFDWRVLIFDIRTADLITEVKVAMPAIFTLLKMDLIGDNLSVCFCEAYLTPT